MGAGDIVSGQRALANLISLGKRRGIQLYLVLQSLAMEAGFEGLKRERPPPAGICKSVFDLITPI